MIYVPFDLAAVMEMIMVWYMIALAVVAVIALVLGMLSGWHDDSG